MTDDVFERRLRETLAKRASVDASPVLRVRVLGVATSPDRRGIVGSRDRVGPTLVLAAAAALIVTFLLRPVAPFPPAITGAPEATLVPGIHPGDGLATPRFGGEFLVICGALAVLAFVIGWLLRARLRSPRRRGAVVVVVAVLVGAVAQVAGSVTVAPGSVFSGGLGWRGDVDLAPPEGVYFPGSNGQLTFGLAITNPGRVPITLKGLGRPAGEDYETALVGLGRSVTAVDLSDGNTLVTDPGKLAPFEPVTLAPGEETWVVVLGATGACILSPGEPYEGASGQTEIPVVLDEFGYEWTERLTLPETVWVAIKLGCVAQAPVPIP
jgi:hypothetical protein